MSNFIIAVIRTVIPIVVGWLVAQLAFANITITPETSAELVLSISTIVASLYYVAVSWLERKWPWFGWLLGVARNPVYGFDYRQSSGSEALATMSTTQLAAEIKRRNRL